MVAGMNFAMANGASMVMIPNARDLKDVLDNISKFKATIFPGVPTLYNAINNHPDVKAGKYDLSSIKACISGSAALLRETKEQFEKLTGGKVFEGYGLSEAPTATHCNPLDGINKTGSIGMPLPDVNVKLVSLDDGETELAQGEIGEIIGTYTVASDSDEWDLEGLAQGLKSVLPLPAEFSIHSPPPAPYCTVLFVMVTVSRFRLPVPSASQLIPPPTSLAFPLLFRLSGFAPFSIVMFSSVVSKA